MMMMLVMFLDINFAYCILILFVNNKNSIHVIILDFLRSYIGGNSNVGKGEIKWQKCPFRYPVFTAVSFT